MKQVVWILLGVPLYLIYRPWFSLPVTLSSGDWPYLFPEAIRTMPLNPVGSFLWLEPYFRLTAKLGVIFLGLSWELTERLFWFFPFLALCVLGSYRLGLRIFQVPQPQRQILAGLASLIYTTNTYILMVVGGGQMGVAMAYALAPFLVSRFLFLPFQKTDTKMMIWAILVGALQLMFDPRLFLITLFGCAVGWWVIGYGLQAQSAKSFLPVLKTLGAAVALNWFWILPNLVNYGESYQAVSSPDSLSYFSFATFSNTIALLHPNWPENIFGKVYFMRPEFLLIPLVAYGGLLFYKRDKRYTDYKNYLCFVLLGLIGAFLAKGTQEPLGWVYRSLGYIPGFFIFRDPTKFFLLISLAYSVLIPWSLWQLGQRMGFLMKKIFKTDVTDGKFLMIIGGLWVVIWVLLISPVWPRRVSGTFQPQRVPAQYRQLKDFLLSHEAGVAVLWVPKVARFGFTSEVYPAIDASTIMADLTPENWKAQFNDSSVQEELGTLQVQYLIIPDDTKEEIFITDYRYDAKLRVVWETALDQTAGLEKIQIPGITKIAVYKFGSRNWLMEIRNR